jgi:hypothetical protein
MKVNRVQRDLFRQLLSKLEKTGVSREQLFSDLRLRGVTASSISQTLAAGAEAMVLLETAADLSGDPCLMIRLGQQLGIASYGSFGFALMSCANLREAVQLLLHYGQVLFEPKWTSYEHEGGLLLRANITVGTAARQQLATGLSFSNLSVVGRSLYGNQVESAEGAEI